MAKRTDDELLAIARQYETIKDWRKNDKAAQLTAWRRGQEFYAKCTAHMTRLRRADGEGYTLEECRDSALRYSTRSEWYRADHKTYYFARRTGDWFDQCVAHMGSPRRASNKNARNYWTLERCLEDLKACLDAGGSLEDWNRNWPGGACLASSRKGWLDEIYAAAGYERKPLVKEKWTLNACKQDALKYQTRVDWYRGERGAYNRACRMDWLDECCAHMESVSGHDSDALYFWEWIDQGKSTGIYKVGVTSHRLDDKRIKQCASANGIDYRLIALCQTSEQDAMAFESVLLDMGDTVPLPDHIKDGRSEFRIYNDEELQIIYQLMGVEVQLEKAA